MSKKEDNPKPVDVAYIIDQAKPRNRRLTAYDPSESAEADELPQPDVESQLEQDDRSSEMPEDDRSVRSEPQGRRPKQRKREIPSYTDAFIRRNEIKRRQCVYISYDVHQKLAALVRVLVESGQEITLGGYIDTVMNDYLQTYKDDINELYRNRTPDLL